MTANIKAELEEEIMAKLKSDLVSVIRVELRKATTRMDGICPNKCVSMMQVIESGVLENSLNIGQVDMV